MKRPKRPLSSYNLFYRFKRDKILEARKNGDESLETINRLIAAVPGLEDHPSLINNISPEQVNDFRRKEIRAAMQENLSPKDNRNRSHRKSHGALSFLEMSKLMVTRWKSIDDLSRSVFEELAEEGRQVYRKRVAEYEAIYPPPSKKRRKTTTSILIDKTQPENKSTSLAPESDKELPSPIVSPTMFHVQVPMAAHSKDIQDEKPAIPSACHIPKKTKQKISPNASTVTPPPIMDLSSFSFRDQLDLMEKSFNNRLANGVYQMLEDLEPLPISSREEK